MKPYQFKTVIGVFALSLATLISCNNEKKTDTTETPTTTEEATSAPKQDTVKVTITGNDKMQFDQSEISVFEGQTVVLTLIHSGTMPVTAMGHNFVLLANGISVSDFAAEAIEAKDNNYIPKEENNIIAHTKLIGGGETTSITFKAPEKGTYDFLCSFPGHSSMMRGEFIVK